MKRDQLNSKKYYVPELLSPAGSLDKLKVSVSYGADAVYLGGQKFGLRAAAENFTLSEIHEGAAYAHDHGALVYVVINSFPFDEDLVDLPRFVSELQKAKVDALIVSDLGAIQVIQETSDIPIHLSTQASCLNRYSARFWKEAGVERIVLGREISLKEAHQIKRDTGLELEMFIHGSMCMAYSGNCTISNFTQGRDSNRGGCAHSCRFEYKVHTGTESTNDYFMSSKDLQGLHLIDQFSSCKIDSVKIEGRMKGPLYAATVTSAYRRALDYYAEHGNLPLEVITELSSELQKFSHRKYTEGSLVKAAGNDSVYDEREHESSSYQVVGTVIEASKDFFVLETKSKIHKGQGLEVLTFKNGVKSFTAFELVDLCADKMEATKPNQLIRFPFIEGVEEFNVVRGIQ